MSEPSLELSASEELSIPSPSGVFTRTFAREVSALFWQDPLGIALPILAADVVKCCILMGAHQLSVLALQALVPHSVLGQPDYAAAKDIPAAYMFLAGGGIRTTAIAISIFLFALAFVFAARKVCTLTYRDCFPQQLRPILRPAVALAVNLFALALLIGGCVILTIYFIPTSWLSSYVKTTTLLLLSCALVAILSVRPLLTAVSGRKLVRMPFFSRASLETWAIIAAGTTSSILISAILTNAHPLTEEYSFIAVTIRKILFSIISTWPYIPMIIALTLIAQTIPSIEPADASDSPLNPPQPESDEPSAALPT